MLRWLLRLIILGLIAAVVIRAIAQVLNREEDFEDYDDLDAGLDFAETPVEIDVTTEETPATSASSAPSVTSATFDDARGTRATETAQMVGAAPGPDLSATTATGTAPGEGSLIDIKGIGPTYAARLREIGISTLDDLAHANPDDVQERLDVTGGRATVQNWIEQAQAITAGSEQTSG